MTSPLEAIQGEIEKIKADVQTAVIIFVVKAFAKFTLALLQSIDPTHSDEYKPPPGLGGPL